MSDTTLRSRLIRLAHTHPQFRKDLLPLLQTKTAASGVDALSKAKGHLKAAFDLLHNMNYNSEDLPMDSSDLKDLTRGLGKLLELFPREEDED